METLVQQFIKAFGWSILNSLWQSAVIYGILFILLFSLPKLASKHKHNLAFLSIIAMFLSFTYNFIHQIIKSSAKIDLSQQQIQTYTYLNNIPQSFSSKAEQYFPIIVIFYLIGVVLQLFVIIKGYNQLSKFKKENLNEIPQDWKAIFEQVLRNLKINKTIKFHLSSIVNVPLVIGYLKPVVLFPLALVNQLDQDQVEAILIHELSHVRRNDFLLNLIKTAIETLLFFNPFVWMAGKFIHIEREHACDDLVLKLTGKPLNYAHALLKLELLKDKSSPAYALAATGKAQNLYQRIKRITNMKTNYLNAKQQMAALTLGVACLFSIAWINPSEKAKMKKAKSIMVSQTAIKTNKPIVFIDTTKKRQIKIVTIDADGKKTEYNSVKEMPDSVKKDFLNDNLSFRKNILMLNFDSLKKSYKIDTLISSQLNARFNGPEWKKQQEDFRVQAKEMKVYFDSPEWKKQQDRIKKQSLELKKRHTSLEWKSQQEDIRQQAEEIRKEFNSEDWKKQQAEIGKQAAELGKKLSLEFSGKMLSAEELTKLQTLTPDVKAELEQLKLRVLLKSSDSKTQTFEYADPNGKKLYFYDDNLKKLRESEEYKKLKENFDKEVKELKEKLDKKDKQKNDKPE